MDSETEATRRRAVDLSTARDAEERPRKAFWGLWEELQQRVRDGRLYAPPDERTEDDYGESFDAYRERIVAFGDES